MVEKEEDVFGDAVTLGRPELGQKTPSNLSRLLEGMKRHKKLVASAGEITLFAAGFALGAVAFSERGRPATT